MRKAQIVVIDFGSQYTQLIARRIREQGVYTEIVSCHLPFETVYERYREVLKGIILSGGPQSVYRKDAPRVPEGLFELGIPLFGICYGLQLMAFQLGGIVHRGEQREYGPAIIRILERDIIFKDLPETLKVWMSHGDIVRESPPGFRVLAETPTTPVTAMAHEERQWYGVQFHPEVVHTEHGKDILKRFVFDVCGCEKDWDLSQYTQELIDQVRTKSKEGGILVAVSGGVDSTVLARLVHEGAGEHMRAVFVNNGLLRKNEADQVIKQLRDRMHIPLQYIDASALFLERLRGVLDPEQKRRIIGETFIDVFKKVAGEIPDIRYFAQGTLYPDVVESGASLGPSAVIKTHHNLVDAVHDLGLEIIEPFRELFKDEVRAIARYLGVPDEVIHRQPFPGPGLAIRIIGEVTSERLDILRETDAILQEEIRKSEHYPHLWQSFAVLIPIKTVGVMGDERSYEFVVALRIVESLDGMTANWVYIEEDLLRQISARIVNEVKGVNRVTLDLTTKPPATIEWE